MLKQPQVTAVRDQLEPGVRDLPGQQPSVLHRDQRVSRAADHQGGRGDPVQPGQAGPPADRVQLQGRPGPGLGDPQGGPAQGHMAHLRLVVRRYSRPPSAGAALTRATGYGYGSATAVKPVETWL